MFLLFLSRNRGQTFRREFSHIGETWSLVPPSVNDGTNHHCYHSHTSENGICTLHEAMLLDYNKFPKRERLLCHWREDRLTRSVCRRVNPEKRRHLVGSYCVIHTMTAILYIYSSSIRWRKNYTTPQVHWKFQSIVLWTCTQPALQHLSRKIFLTTSLL